MDRRRRARERFADLATNAQPSQRRPYETSTGDFIVTCPMSRRLLARIEREPAPDGERDSRAARLRELIVEALDARDAVRGVR
jgi:hypothetical protein